MTVSQSWRCPTCSGLQQAEALTFGRLTVCGRVMVAYLDGRPLPLTRLEILLLCYLAERAGTVCRWDEVLAAVWGPDWPGVSEWRGASERHLLGVHISRLRRQLGPMGGVIETRLNVGYLMPRPDTVADTVPYVGRAVSPHAGALQREILECLRARPMQWVSVESILIWVRQTRPLRHRHHVAMSISRLPLHERSVEVRYRGQYVAAAMLSGAIAMSSKPIPIRPPCRTWTEADWHELATAYASLERLYVLLEKEHRRATTRRLWWDFWSFALGALAMAIVIALLASVGR